MTCDDLYPQLTALLDGELAPGDVAEAERHLAGCPGCAEAQADHAALKEMVAAWTVDAPDIGGRVMQAAASDDQRLLLGEMRRLRAEMAEMRVEMAALRRSVSRRADLLPWTPSAQPDYPEPSYSQMENDPWNLIRS